jgi:hypothetical protein
LAVLRFTTISNFVGSLNCKLRRLLAAQDAIHMVAARRLDSEAEAAI